jgi:hypothetical protein
MIGACDLLFAALLFATGRAFMEHADILPVFAVIKELATAVGTEGERVGVGA